MNTKYLISAIIIIFIMIFNVNISYASDISNVITGGDSFLNAADDDQKIDDVELKSVSDMIYNILLVLGMSIAIIISGVLGIKFMIGSVEEKAQVKDALVPFIIGCIVIFGAFSIWKIAVNIGNAISLEEETTTQTTTIMCPQCKITIDYQAIQNGKCDNCGCDL